MPAEGGAPCHRQRLREKFIKSGLSGFHDYEIVELLLTPDSPTVIARNRPKRLPETSSSPPPLCG
jgi:DNA repair protein RadC